MVDWLLLYAATAQKGFIVARAISNNITRLIYLIRSLLIFEDIQQNTKECIRVLNFVLYV